MQLHEKIRIIEHYKIELSVSPSAKTVVLTNPDGENQEFDASFEDVATAVIAKMKRTADLAPGFYDYVSSFYNHEQDETAKLLGHQIAGSSELGFAINELIKGGYNDEEANAHAQERNLSLDEYWMGWYLPLSLGFSVDICNVKALYEKLKGVASYHAQLYREYEEEYIFNR